MEIEQNILKEIAIEYFDIGDEEKFNNDWKNFIYCYERMRNCPCVKAKDLYSFIDALYLVASDIANYAEKHKSLEDLVDDALYRIYDEDAIPSLSEQYIRIKKLER